jgi:hypothetical protein
MAKKIVPQEVCLFCSRFPCECNVTTRNKLLRELHRPDKDSSRERNLEDGE